MAEWHEPQQRPSPQQQNNSLLAAQMNSLPSTNGQWQSSSLPRLHADTSFDLCQFDGQDITLSSDGLDLHSNTRASRTMSDHSIGSSLPSWSSGFDDWPTTSHGPPDFGAQVWSPMIYPTDLTVPWESLSESNTSTDTLASSRAQDSLLPMFQSNNMHNTPVSISSLASMTHLSLPTPCSTALNFTQVATNADIGGNRKCYEATVQILAQINEQNINGASLSLDKLLELDRQLQETLRKVLACHRCMDASGDQTMIMLVFMALDNILSLFEKQQKTTDASMHGVDSTSPHSLCPDRMLSVGSFMVDDKVKDMFLRQLVLGFLEGLESILVSLKRQTVLVLKGFKLKLTQEMAGDISRRALFLQGLHRMSG